MAAGFGGPSEVLPEYCLRDLALRYGARVVVYLLLRVFVCVVVCVLSDALGLVVDGVVEIVLVVGVVCRHFDYPGPSFDGGDLLAWCRPLSILPRAAVLPLEVSLLAVVVVGDVGLVLMRPYVPLVGVYVYGPSVVPVGRAGKMMPALVVSLVGLGRTDPTLALLLAYVLAIVDLDRYGDIRVEAVRTVFVVEYVLDFLLEAVVEELYEPFLVEIGP